VLVDARALGAELLARGGEGRRPGPARGFLGGGPGGVRGAPGPVDAELLGRAAAAAGHPERRPRPLLAAAVQDRPDAAHEREDLGAAAHVIG